LSTIAESGCRLPPGVQFGLPADAVREGVDVAITASAIRDDGSIIGISKIARDISSRKDSERNGARLAAIVESSDDAIIAKDLNGVITTWNPAAERMFGYTEREAVGQSIRLIIPESHQDEEDTILNSIKRGESMQHFETIRCRKDGSLLPISVTVSPIRNKAGVIIGASKIAHDISDRKRAEAEAQRAKRQYDLVDPENRLVASELETRWNRALQSVTELESRVQTLTQAPPSISLEQKKQLLEMGQELPRLWNDPQAPVELKKQILRTVIAEIVAQSAPESTDYRLQIHWAGGVHTELVVPRNKRGLNSRRADGKVLELVGELVKVCDDRMIAITLNRLGYRTGQGNNWSVSRVGTLRHTHGLAKFEKRADWLTLEEAAQVLECPLGTVKWRVAEALRQVRAGLHAKEEENVPCLYP